MSLLTKVLPAVKVAGRFVGVLGKHENNLPVTGRKARLVGSVVALLAAWGYFSPEQAEAVVNVVLALLEYATF